MKIPSKKSAGIFARVLAVPQLLLAPFVAFRLPTDASKVPFLATAPEGLKLAFVADSAAQADMLRQLLLQNDFHPEHVASTTMGFFGVNASPNIFVPIDEADDAAEFIRDYLAPHELPTEPYIPMK